MSRSSMVTDVEKVIDGGFCVGCGGCAAIDEGINMRFTEQGTYIPVITKVTNPKIDEVCPFSNSGPNENDLAEPSLNLGNEEKLGSYLTLKAGYDLNESRRLNSSSGGGASWILSELFSHGHIDRVIHIKEAGNDGKLFEYSISDSPEQINNGAKTRYYPIEISQVVKFVKSNAGKYAFVGVPCFIKTVKRLALVDKEFSERLKFTISIFCGHLKSAAFGESLAWQLDVEPSNIKKIDFRHKILTAPANEYGIEVIDNDEVAHVSQMKFLLGKDWGMGAFRLKACDFCDDIVGELADVSFGDAWLEKYKPDSKGTNLIIIRNELIKQIFENGLTEGTFYTEDISSAEVVKSQDASYRHRRNGVTYRAEKYQKKSKWHPVKRKFSNIAKPDLVDKVNWNFRAWYSQQTHEYFAEAKRKGAIEIYTNFVKKGTYFGQKLQKLIRIYKSVMNRLKRIVK